MRPSDTASKLRHEPVAVSFVKLLGLDELSQQVDRRRRVVAVAFEFGDDPILTVDLLLAQGDMPLGSSQKFDQLRTVHGETSPSRRPRDARAFPRRADANRAGPVP